MKIMAGKGIGIKAKRKVNSPFASSKHVSSNSVTIELIIEKAIADLMRLLLILLFLCHLNFST